MSLNHVTISGNLTRDPELRSTSSGMPVLTFSVAVNERQKNAQTGEWEDRANFVDCTMFGARAEGVSRYLAKGSKVALSGKLRWSQWEKDGQKRSKLEVIVGELDFMSRSEAQQGQQYQQPAQSYQQQQYAPQTAPQPAQQYPYTAAPLYDDDIPF